MSRCSVPAHLRVLHDQLERASLSAVLNVAEGAGRHSRRDKRRHYAIARDRPWRQPLPLTWFACAGWLLESVCDQARSLACA